MTCRASRFSIVGSEEARLRASLRPPPKLPVHISCRQLSRRLSDARMEEKELNRSAEQARTRRRAASLAAVSSPHYASAGTDARCFTNRDESVPVGVSENSGCRLIPELAALETFPFSPGTIPTQTRRWNDLQHVLPAIW